MRKHTRRKVRDPMGWIMARSPIANDQARDLSIAYRMSFQAMRTGHGSEQTWSTLACALNVALILAEGGNMAGNTDCVKAGMDALVSCRERAGHAGKWAFSGDEMKAMMRALAIHDEQIESTTRAAVTAALIEVRRRIDSWQIM